MLCGYVQGGSTLLIESAGTVLKLATRRLALTLPTRRSAMGYCLAVMTMIVSSKEHGAMGIGIDISYDAVPYPDYSYFESHPDRVATMATLFGMKPPPVDRCRVLELGCAGGGNLIPMAYGLPQSEFVGIDTSARQIAAGQEKASALGLKNVTLQPLDILDVNTDHGQFDYIIAHGVFSWVPRVVQDKIL